MAKQPEEQNLLDAIRDLKNRDPFTPFKVIMSSGDVITIEDPDLLAMNQSQLFYCLPKSSRVMYLRASEIVAVDNPGERPRRKRAG